MPKQLLIDHRGTTITAQYCCMPFYCLKSVGINVFFHLHVVCSSYTENMWSFSQSYCLKSIIKKCDKQISGHITQNHPPRAAVSSPGFEWGAARTPAEPSLFGAVVEPRQDQDAVVRLVLGISCRSLLLQRHDALHQAHDGCFDVGVVLERNMVDLPPCYLRASKHTRGLCNE